MALTDSWLKAHDKKPHATTLEKADGEGLSVRVSPAGKLVFQMRYRVNGTATRLDLGVYPRVSLKEARVEHQRLKAELEQGRDPKGLLRLEAAGIVDAHTNESLYRAWHENYCLANKMNAAGILRSFEIHIFPELGALPADRTTANAWLTVIEKVADKTPSIAERLLNNAKQLHKWANRRALMKTKPLIDVSARGDLMITRTESGRSLSDAEISLMWHSLDKSRMAPSNKLFIQLCLFFGCRNGELRELDPIEDLDLEAMTWTIPPWKNKVRRKVRRSIIRPLIPEVLPYIAEAVRLSHAPNFLFTQDGSPRQLGANAVLCMPYRVRNNSVKHYGVEMEHWSMHDLRKTARTNFSSLTTDTVAEVMLGHSLQGMQGVYDRHLYLDEQRAAYHTWWQRLQGIIAVVPARKPSGKA